MNDNDFGQVNNRPHKIKTHIEIEDVSTLLFNKFTISSYHLFMLYFRVYSSRNLKKVSMHKLAYMKYHHLRDTIKIHLQED